MKNTKNKYLDKMTNFFYRKLKLKFFFFFLLKIRKKFEYSISKFEKKKFF